MSLVKLMAVTSFSLFTETVSPIVGARLGSTYGSGDRSYRNYAPFSTYCTESYPGTLHQQNHYTHCCLYLQWTDDEIMQHLELYLHKDVCVLSDPLDTTGTL